MKLKILDIFNIYQGIKNIIDLTENVDALFKFKLLGIMREIKPYIENFEIIKNDKIKKYGCETEDKSYFIDREVDPENFDKFTKELEEIMNSEVNISVSRLKAIDIFDKNVPSDYLMYLYLIIDE